MPLVKISTHYSLYKHPVKFLIVLYSRNKDLVLVDFLNVYASINDI